MDINIQNVPEALKAFVIGVFANLVMYYIMSPAQGDLIGLLSSIGIGTVDNTTKLMVWTLIAIVGILANLIYPIWVLFDEDNGGMNGQ